MHRSSNTTISHELRLWKLDQTLNDKEVKKLLGLGFVVKPKEMNTYDIYYKEYTWTI